MKPSASLLFLAARDAAVQGGVLLHAVCAGRLRLAHLPDEEAHVWTLPPGQILLVSARPVTPPLLPFSLLFFPDLE